MVKHFVVQTLLDDKMVKDFVDFQMLRDHKAYFGIFHWLQRLGVLLLVGSMMMGLYQQGAMAEKFYATFSLFLGALFLLLVSVLAPRIKVRRMHENLFIRHRENTLVFYEDRVQVIQGQLREEMLYQDIYACYETEYFFYLRAKKVYILPKAGFTQGDPTDFPAFMNKKTGLEIARERRYDSDSHTFVAVKEKGVWLHKLICADFKINTIMLRISPLGVKLLYRGETTHGTGGVYALQDDRGCTRHIALHRGIFSEIHLAVDTEYYRISRQLSETEKAFILFAMGLFFAGAVFFLAALFTEVSLAASLTGLGVLAIVATLYTLFLRNLLLTHYVSVVRYIASGSLLIACFILVVAANAGADELAQDFRAAGWVSVTDTALRAQDSAQPYTAQDLFYAKLYAHTGLMSGALRQFDWSEAAFSRALVLTPNFAEIYYNRGIAYQEEKSLAMALADFHQAIVLAPDFFAAYAKRGLLYEELGDPQQALADYTTVIAAGVAENEIYYRRGLIYSARREYEPALADLTQAIALAPEQTRGYYARGTVFSYMGNHEAAAADLSIVIERRKRDAKAYYARSLIYGKAGKFELSVNDSTKAIEYGGKKPAYYASRGRSYAMLGQYEKAVANYDQLVALRPNDATAYLERGNAHSNLGAFDQAIADYGQSIALDGEFALAYYNRGLCYSSVADFAHSIPDYTRTVELDPTHAAAFANRGSDYFYLGEPQKCLDDYGRAIALTPDDGLFYLNRSSVYRSLGRMEEANEDYRKAVALDPKLKNSFVGKPSIQRSAMHT